MDLQKAKEYSQKLFYNKWVKWIHEGSRSAETSFEKSLNAIVGVLSKHCAICLNLNGCCFVKEKCPKQPLHPNCHCITIDIPTITAIAECPIEKFTKYVFADGNSKKKLFVIWGYDIMDSEYLKKEFEKQAKIAYSLGNYELGKLDKHGQRINIRIELKRRDNDNIATFLTGWMVYPNGKIVLITPYGEK